MEKQAVGYNLYSTSASWTSHPSNSSHLPEKLACEQRLDRGETAKLDPADSGGGNFLSESAGKRGVRESDGVD